MIHNLHSQNEDYIFTHLKILTMRYLSFCFLLASLSLSSQTYYPPIASDQWETLSLSEANYNTEAYQPLVDFLSESESKGFILLKGGKIVIEEYFDDFTQESNWYWASAGKSLTATIVGKAQEEGYLNLEDYTHQYLGDDWTECTGDSIKIIHQLTMTSGLDYTVPNSGCTLPECLLCLNDPGTEWFYHNAPYTLLDKVVENATGTNYNNYTRSSITNRIGMVGLWIRSGDNNLYWSTPRSMARFGLMALSNGSWDGEQILNQTYFDSMVNTSQDINESYGYLWWLNGKQSHRLPSTTFTFSGSIVPNAPDDMYAAIGKNSQLCMVIPSLDMVIIRMGEDPDVSLVPTNFLIDLWNKVEALLPTTSTSDTPKANLTNHLYPNPISVRQNLTIESTEIPKQVVILSSNGNIITKYLNSRSITIPSLAQGLYIIQVEYSNKIERHRIIIQ